MPSPAFGPFFEIFSDGVVMTAAVITTFAFAERCWKRSAPLNVTGLLASVIAVFYAVYGLTYWFNGMKGYNCTTLAIVNGTCMSASNALTYLHLFVKAEVSNRRNPRWRHCFRWIGVITTIFNWVTLIVVHALLVGKEVQGLDGPRCQFVFEMNTFKLKWVAQFINQAFQVAAFVSPLITHVRLMNSGAQKTGKKDTAFKDLVVRALVASGVSLTFTAIVTVLAFTEMREMEAGTDNIIIPVFPLAVLDNAINLGAIFFAINITSNSETSKDGQTRVRHGSDDLPEVDRKSGGTSIGSANGHSQHANTGAVAAVAPTGQNISSGGGGTGATHLWSFHRV